MSLSTPATGIKGYNLIEWYNELQKYLAQRYYLTYQVHPDDRASITTAVNMTLTKEQTHISLSNPGDINLPLAFANVGKVYSFYSFPNPNIALSGFNGNGCRLVPFAGDTVGNQSAIPMLLYYAPGPVVDARVPISFISDGVSNWIGFR